MKNGILKFDICFAFKNFYFSISKLTIKALFPNILAAVFFADSCCGFEIVNLCCLFFQI